MKGQENQNRGPVPRLRLYLGAFVLVPAFMALMVAITAGSVYVIFTSGTRLVQVAGQGGVERWERLGDLPGIPEQLAADADGTLWARTRLPGSIARCRNETWEVFRRDALGTPGSPERDFVVLGNRVWAVIGDRLVHFDGRAWSNQPIPRPAADHVLAAGQETVWLLGNDGVLRTFSGGEWETADLRRSIAGAAWDPEQPYRAPDLLAAEDGSLWLCANVVWRRTDGAWPPVEVAGRPLRGVELLGHAGGRVWFRAGENLLWVTCDAASFGLFSHEQLGLESDGFVDGVYEVGARVCASGTGGVRVLENGRWELKWPAPEGVQRCEAVAGAGGAVYAIATYIEPIPALWLGTVLAAFVSAAAIWGIRRFIDPPYPLWSAFRPQYLAVVVLLTVPMVLATFLGTAGSIVLLIAPLALATVTLLVPPLLIVAMVFRDLGERRLEIVRLRPVTTAQTPAAARAWFEQNTPYFAALGFRALGDFSLKEQSEHFTRFLINARGDVIGEIAWTKSAPWRTLKCYAFASVTDDLTYLETGNVSLPKEQFDGHFVLQGVPRATVAEALDAHRRRLAELLDQRGTKALCLGEEDVEKVAVYGQKLCYTRLKERGVIPSNPYDGVTFDFTRPDAVEETPIGSGTPPLDFAGDWQSPDPVGSV